jgi:AmmeMemoRadiSam system protein B/AmmeMemoRadiSam system protein A
MPFVRPAAVAGMFYPADPAELRAAVDGCLRPREAPPPPPPRPPKMLLVPHAGLTYSGPVAGQAYAALKPWRDWIRRVVLLGPAHRVVMHGLALPSVEAFETPLGRVPLDRTALTRVAALPQVMGSDPAHAHEHSLEVQLPFLQRVLGEFRLVPLVVGEVRPADVTEVLDELWGGDETLVVLSSDLSHYLDAARAETLDQETVQRLLSLQAAITPHQACGAHLLNGALPLARRHGLQPRLADLRHSGHGLGGDSHRVVGYAALVFDAADSSAGASVADDSPALGQALCLAARNAIARAMGQPLLPEPDLPALHQGGATFVSLRDAHGELRGCVGRPLSRRPLLEDVRANARAAAFDDSRHPPLQPPEWPGLHVEVTLLAPLEELHALDEADALAQLEPGCDGLMLQWQGRSATLLPQAWADQPERPSFLATAKARAGLAPDFWSPQIRLWRFGARHFDLPVATASRP